MVIGPQGEETVLQEVSLSTAMKRLVELAVGKIEISWTSHSAIK